MMSPREVTVERNGHACDGGRFCEAFQALKDENALEQSISLTSLRDQESVAEAVAGVVEQFGKYEGTFNTPFHEDLGFAKLTLEATEADSDRDAIDHGLVAITPLRLDLTDFAALDAVQAKAAE